MRHILHNSHTALYKFCTLFNIKPIFIHEHDRGPLKRYDFLKKLITHIMIFLFMLEVNV